MNQIREIAEGFINDTLPDSLLSAELLRLSNERENVCNGCSMKDGNRCSQQRKGKAVIDFKYRGRQRIKGELYKGCGCFLSKKQKSKISQCPLGQWENL